MRALPQDISPAELRESLPSVRSVRSTQDPATQRIASLADWFKAKKGDCGVGRDRGRDPGCKQS